MTRMASWLVAAPMSLLLGTLATAEDTGAKPGPGAESPSIDEHAIEILRRATDRLSAAQRFHLQAYGTFDVVQESGQKLQFGTAHDLNVRRPDGGFGAFRHDDGHVRRIWYDGATLTVYDSTENVYGQIPVPETLDAALDYVELELGAPVPLADFLYSDLSHLTGLAREASYVGKSRVGEWDCDHLAFRGEAVDWQVWVEQGDEPLIRKALVTYRELPAAPQFGVLFREWDLSPELPDSLFVFTPPDGAEKLRTLALPRRGQLVEGEIQ